MLPPDRPGVWHRPLPDGATDALPMAEQAWGMTVYWQGGRPVAHVLAMPDGTVRRNGPAQPSSPQGTELIAPLTVSVVICTRDRPDDIARCLASLPAQTRPADEVIVVDNASRDERTKQAVLAAGVTYLRDDRPGLDFARNTGVTAASCDLIVFTDDDVLLDPTWLERIVAAFDAPKIGAVTGLVLPAELASESQLLFERYWSFNHGYHRRDVTAGEFDSYQGRDLFHAWDLGAGANMAFRRAVFADAGLFDERLGAGQAGCSDDSEYWYRLLHHGWTCRYEPAAVVYHYHRGSLGQLSHQIEQYMRGHVAALLIQFQRTRRSGNLWRVAWGLPNYYLRRIVKRWVLQRRHDGDRFIGKEIAGYFSGLRFYVENRKRRG